MESLFDEESMQTEIDINTKFRIPKEIVVRKYLNHNLVIYTEGVLWLVFSDEELVVFESFKSGKTIAEALELFDEDDVISVITQIEAKQFEHPVIHHNTEINMYIYLTNNCNERCKHCYMYAGDIQIEELDSSAWIKVLEEYKMAGGNGVTFTGGEVTVYPGFKAVLKRAHELGLITTVLTNGILWDESSIQECAEYIDEVQISIDGYDRDSYYAVRQYDGFDVAVKNLLSFNENGVRSSMAVTPLLDDLTTFVERFEAFARHILETYPQIYIRFNLELLNGRDITNTKSANIEYRKKIRALVERLYPNYYTETFSINYEGHIIRPNCGFGEITVAANGDIYWCNRIHELSSTYNIMHMNMSAVIEQSKKIKELTDVNHSETCRVCEIRYICGGDCRMNYQGIEQADQHEGLWYNTCPVGQKESYYKKMIACNDYFYEGLLGE